MTLSLADIKKLALPLVLALALIAAGAVLIWFVHLQLAGANTRQVAAKNERSLARDRLERISEEEREVKERIEVYRRLRNLNIIGRERRLEWIDAIQRIRTGREMLDVRYRIEPQKSLLSLPGKPAGIDFYSSALKVDVALLHEGDLLAFLGDLRESGNQYTSVQRCTMTRSGVSAAAGPSLAARLRAQCEIHLITIVDRAAKQPS